MLHSEANSEICAVLSVGCQKNSNYNVCPLNTSDLQPYTNRILDAQPGYLLIGVKDSGTVVGLKRSEEKLKVIATEAVQNTNLTFHIVKLVADFKVIVITNKT